MSLLERVAFDEIDGEGDEFGGGSPDPVERFRTRAAFLFLRGGEQILAGRLAGTQAIVVTVRAMSSTSMLSSKNTTKWQMRDLSTGIAYNVRSVQPNRDRPRQFLDILCESGT